MSIPNLPGINELSQMGVKRVSLVPTLFQTAYSHARMQPKQFMAFGDFAGLVNHGLPGSVLNMALKM